VICTAKTNKNNQLLLLEYCKTNNTKNTYSLQSYFFLFPVQILVFLNNTMTIQQFWILTTAPQQVEPYLIGMTNYCISTLNVGLGRASDG